MAQTINTNLASLSAQRNLAASQKDAATAMQRLSSGLRINSAKDDAAGLAIANRLTSQINGLNQGVRNANDALSVVQIAEGALSETSDILQRMRSLAVQSLNASNSVGDRSALQTEMEQLHQEITRIASTTAFGNTKLLNGTFSQKSFQVGANVGESVNVSIKSAMASDLGAQNTLTFGDTTFQVSKVSASATKAANSSAIAAQTLTFTNTPPGGTAVTTTVGIDADASAAEIADSITARVDGVRASAKTVFRLTDGGITYNAGDNVSVEINGVTLTVDVGANADALFTNLYTAATAESSLSNLSFVDNAAYLEITDETGADVTFGVTSEAGSADLDFDTDAYSDTAANSGSVLSATGSSQDAIVLNGFTTVTGYVSMVTTDATSTHTVAGTVAVGATGIISTAATGTVTTGTTKLDDVDVTTVANAKTAVDIIDTALTTLGSERAVLGSIQNRMDAVISNLSNISENSQAARSRIMDADFASETAALARTQILQQAGISVLAQANAQPQNVLALLQ